MSAAIGDDGCCDTQSTAVASHSQSIEQAQDSHQSDMPLNCDCSSCLNCVHCGTASILRLDAFSLSLTAHLSTALGGYLSSIAPAPDMEGPFQPPKA